MDPLVKIPQDLHILVFQHFSVTEILEFSEISQEWFEKLAKSKCLKKMKFSLKSWRFLKGTRQQQTEEKTQVLRNSIRQYQSVAIDCRFDRNLSEEFWKFLEFAAPFVRELKIRSIKLDSPKVFPLPKLKVLKLTYISSDIRNILLTSSNSLTKLKLKMESPLKWNETLSVDQGSIMAVRGCMEKNQDLEELELHGSVQYNTFFDGDFSEVVKFRLKTLKIKTGMRLALISERNEQHFLNFLETQSSSLQNFFIDVCRPNVIQQAFNQMPSVTSFHIDVMMMSDYKVRDLELNLNERIVDLKIPYVSHLEDIKAFLEVAPNLRSLFVAHLSHETMEFIAWNLMSLTELKFRYDEIDCEGFYEQLKDDHPDVNQNIEMIVDYEYT